MNRVLDAGARPARRPLRASSATTTPCASSSSPAPASSVHRRRRHRRVHDPRPRRISRLALERRRAGAVPEARDRRSAATASASASSSRWPATSASPPTTRSSAFPRSALGMIPGSGGTQRLARLSVSAARRTSHARPAHRRRGALAWGLVTEVVPPDELDAAVDARDRRPAGLSPLALAHGQAGAQPRLRRAALVGLELEGLAYGLLRTTDDFAEGVEAFGEKRPRGPRARARSRAAPRRRGSGRAWPRGARAARARRARRSRASTAASSSSAGTTSVTRPERERLRARDPPAAHDDSFARPSPTSRVSRCVPPVPGIIPSPTSGRPTSRPRRRSGSRRRARARGRRRGSSRGARDHRLRAALGGRDVPREPREMLRLARMNARDVPAGRERLAGSGDDDDADPLVLAEPAKSLRELVRAPPSSRG